MSEKKKVSIMGTLLYPLEIGSSAVIQEEKAVRITSNVQHFITSPSGVVQIETMNTWYVLHPVCGEKKICV